MAIKIETIEALKEKIKNAPEIEKEKKTVSKQEAIKELRRDIEALQKKGYSLEEIAKFMSDGGLPITTPTLKSYLQRTKATKPKPPKQEKKIESSPQQNGDKKDEPKTIKQEEKPENKGSFEVRPDSLDI